MKIGQRVKEIWSGQESVTDRQTSVRQSVKRKSAMVHNIQVDILKLVYHHPGLGGEFQGLGLWYVERQNVQKTVGSPLRFHFLQVTHFSLSNSCSSSQTAQRQ